MTPSYEPVCERQLARVPDHRLGAVGDAGNAGVAHETLRRVVLDAVIAAVDIDGRDRHARSCQQQPYRGAARARADIDDAARSR